MLLMWLGEQITERGIGNGISLIITIGILARLPQRGQALIGHVFPGGENPTHSSMGTGLLLIVLLVAVIAGVIAVTQAQRKIPVQYASALVGRKMYQGGTTFMPLRVNYAGVMPIIFASVHPDVSAACSCTWLAMRQAAVFADHFRALARQLNYGSLAVSGRFMR